MANQVATLENPQQMEVPVSGTGRLIICSGIAPIDQFADAGATTQIWTWRVGPVLSHVQFQRAICDGSLVRISHSGGNANWSLVALDADWDDESGYVEVRAEIQVTATGAGATVRVQGISYHVSILATDVTETGVPLPQPTPPAATSFIVTPSAYDFGVVPIGQFRDQSFTIINGSVSASPVPIGLLGPNAGEFSIIASTATTMTPLQPGGMFSAMIRFQPTSSGPKNAVFQVSDGSTTMDVQLTGSGLTETPPSTTGTAPMPTTPPPAGYSWVYDQKTNTWSLAPLGTPPPATGSAGTIAVAPSVHDFGAVKVGTYSDKSFTITNTGTVNISSLSVEVFGLDASQFTIIGSTTKPGLPPGGVFPVPIRFQPASSGSKNAVLRINYGGSTPVDVPLTGSGLTETPPPATTPTIAVAPSVYDFGAVQVGVNRDQSVAITNTGTVTISSLSFKVFGLDASQFTIIGSPTKPGLPPGGVFPQPIKFQPTLPGPKNALLRIDYGGSTPVDVPLKGSGV